MFDVAKLTLDEVGEEIDNTIDKLSRLQALYSAMLAQDHRRIDKLIADFKEAQRKEIDDGARSAQTDSTQAGEAVDSS